MEKLVFYKNQVPAEHMRIAVVDETNRPRNLNAYSSAVLFLIDPDGERVDAMTGGGMVSFVDRAAGIMLYRFPEHTLFTKRGQYEMQLKLMSGTREDFTDVGTLHVIESLEG